MTQKEKVIEYISKNGVITTKDATEKLWIMDLQGVIRNLKNDGYFFYTGYKNSKNSRYKGYAFYKRELDKFLQE